MIDVRIAVHIHDELVDEFGGIKGIRDLGSLEAALNRPFATFDGVDLYPTAIDKAAALFESLIINHPFMDGNKRIAYILMKFLLSKNGIRLKATKDEKYQMVIEASKGAIRLDEIKLWIELNTTTNK
jgi:death-on-curing protein